MSAHDSLVRHVPPALGPTLRAPGFVKLLLEGRAPWEYAALLASLPMLGRLPAGDGHPVIVFPGLAAGDLSTRPLRRFLQQRGYLPYAWKLGANFGPRAGVVERCEALLDEVWERHRVPMSLIGWSLGGIYAREMAKRRPERVRCVITLGTPFTGHPRATRAWRLYEWLSGTKAHDPRWAERVRQAPEVPTTSIYSRSDGIVAWQCSVNPQAPHTENIELPASHFGLGVNPLSYLVISDRLAQTPAHWHRFEPRGIAQWLIRTGDPAMSAG
jgi:pimeloyl-ACP methyl ester carboxylesterase